MVTFHSRRKVTTVTREHDHDHEGSRSYQDHDHNYGIMTVLLKGKVGLTVKCERVNVKDPRHDRPACELDVEL